MTDKEWERYVEAYGKVYKLVTPKRIEIEMYLKWKKTGRVE